MIISRKSRSIKEKNSSYYKENEKQNSEKLKDLEAMVETYPRNADETTEANELSVENADETTEAN